MAKSVGSILIQIYATVCRGGIAARYKMSPCKQVQISVEVNICQGQGSRRSMAKGRASDVATFAASDVIS